MSPRSHPPVPDGAARLRAVVPGAGMLPDSAGRGWTPRQEGSGDPFWPEPPWELPVADDERDGLARWTDPGAGATALGSRYAITAGPPVARLAIEGADGASGERDPAPAHSAERGAGVRARMRGDGVLAGWLGGRFDLGRRGVAALALIAVLAAGVTLVLLLRGRPAEESVPVPMSVPGTARVPQVPARQVVVAVGGKVRRPGLLRLPAGSRVDDAVRAAGGVLPGVTDPMLNLARPLADGEQVLVGVPAQPGVPGTTGGTGQPVLLDLNAATLTDLDALPGIGPVMAQRIVDWRTEHGRFASVDQLREVSGIGEAKYQTLKPKVRV